MGSLDMVGNKQKYKNTPIFIEKVPKNKKLTQFELYQFSVSNMSLNHPNNTNFSLEIIL